MQRVEKLIEIDAPIERVFDLFSHFENFPRWMSHIRDVHYSGEGYTRWKADAPLGTSVEWEAGTTDFDPPRRIAWRSVRGDVETEGEVRFRETRRGTTMMRVRLGYQPPAGRVGSFVASLFGKGPAQQLDDDLERFAEVAERGPGRRPKRTPSEPRRAVRGRENERELYDKDASRGRRRRTGDYTDERRFREERRMDFNAEWDERLGQPGPLDAEDVEEREWRHALTPRERERELARRTPDFEYRRDAFRRGVDRLMDDEPPSRRWRRWD